MVSIRPDEISNIIRQQIESYDQDVQVSNVGTVLQVGDGTARIYGLEKAMSQELLEFEDGTIEQQNVNQLKIYFPCDCGMIPANAFNSISEFNSSIYGVQCDPETIIV